MQDCYLEDVRKLVELIKEHKGKIVVYTGAGISTSASIPDYRGTNGLWTSRLKINNQTTPTSVQIRRISDQGIKIKFNGCNNAIQTQRKQSTSFKPVPLKLRLPEASIATPTFTHMAIKVLVEKEYVRHVISQNVDGLHLRSGLERSKLSELHGNLFIEQCIACGFNVFRSFDVAETTGRSQHYTGRICPQCTILRPMECLLSRGILDNAARKLTTSKPGLSPTREELMLSYRKASRKLVRSYESIRNKAKEQIPSIELASQSASLNEHLKTTAPLLRDVVVHFFEKQPTMGLNEIYRIQAAIEAVHGRACLQNADNDAGMLKGRRKRMKVENDVNNLSWLKQDSSISNTDEENVCQLEKTECLEAYVKKESDECCKTNEGPSSLIIVVGSSLSVLKNYQFLWPYGLGRCAHTNSRKRTSSQLLGSCRLVIVNLQPTCKDGFADLVLRVPCDELFRTVMIDHLGLDVPNYNATKDDPLYYEGIPLGPHEEATRTRPDIPFMDF